MSLKAGGVGINLTAASNAFVMVCDISIYKCPLKIISVPIESRSLKHENMVCSFKIWKLSSSSWPPWVSKAFEADLVETQTKIVSYRIHGGTQR